MDKHGHLKFMLYPEVFEPKRIPSMFSLPTHIFWDSGSIIVTPTGGRFYLEVVMRRE